jgi:hypothetical protein
MRALLSACVTLLAHATVAADLDDVPVSQRNVCNGDFSLLATLEGHGTDERMMPTGKVSKQSLKSSSTHICANASMLSCTLANLLGSQLSWPASASWKELQAFETSYCCALCIRAC